MKDQFTPRIREKIDSVINRFNEPFFFYDLDKLKTHLESMANNLDPDIKLWYACKANPMSAVIKVLRNLGFGIDVASTGELHQVLNTGIDPKHIIATGPGKSKAYLEKLVESGVKTIVLESLNQVYWLNEIGKEKNIKIDSLLRVQLDWEEGKSVLGGDEVTPFGISSTDWQSLDKSKTDFLNINGFHVFQWGNILDIKVLEKIWRKTIEEVLKLSKILNIETKVLDLGGGLGIPYDFHSPEIDFQDVHSLLVSLKEEYKLKKIWMELGRFTVGECGYYFTKIVDIKETRGKKIIVCDGGINHIARVALVNQPFPAKAYNQSENHSGNQSELFHIHGSLCTALDFLGAFGLPSDVEIGDWIVFHKTGAYGFTESMPFFLCHVLPGEVIYYNGDLMIPRPPKSSYDWMI